MSSHLVSNLLVLFVCLSSSAFADSTDQRYLAGLRDRGLYRLAEVYCQERIDSGELAERELAEMTIELSLAHQGRAFDAPPHDRDQHWRAAHGALESFLQPANRPYRLLVDLQSALLQLEQAELEQLEQPDAEDRVKELLRQSIAGLRDVAGEIERRRQQLALRQSRDPPEFSPAELDSLDRHVSLALARAYREQGLTYAAESADRVNALQQAIEALERLAGATPPDEIAWQARVALAESLAELGRSDEGLGLVARWSQDLPPTELAAAHLRLLTAAGRLDDAAGLAEQLRTGESPQVDLAHLELLLARAAASGESVAVEQLLATIRTAHGPRWVRRSETMVGRSLADRGGSDSAGGQALAAEHFYHAGKLDAAVAAYDRAAELHRQQQDREAAFAAERTAAAIVGEQGDYLQSAARFRRLALGSLDRDGSAADHREAILALAAAARESSGDKRDKHLGAYLEACREHLRHWSATMSAGEVRLWLGQSLVARKQWPAAIEVLGETPASSPHYEPAMALLATAYRQHAESLDDVSAKRELIAQATDVLQRFVLGEEHRWPVEWQMAQRRCSLELARLQLSTGQAGAAYAEQILRAALSGQPPPDATWRAEAAPVLAMALVDLGKPAEAIDSLRKLSTDSTQAGGNPSLEPMVANLVDSLADLDASDQQRASVGQLILATIELAGTGTGEWTQPVDRYRAAALAAVANIDEARRLYEAQIAEHPRDGDLQVEYAQLLAAAGDHERALAAWGRVESGSGRGGTRWLHARRARIELLTRLGRQQEAQKLEQLTRVLYPDFAKE